MSQKLKQALDLHQAGDLGRARSLYQEILRDDPQNADAHQYLGLLVFQTGDSRQAMEHIGRAVTLNPAVASYHDYLGVVEESRGDYQAALESYQTAARLGEEDADRWFNMAIAFERLGQLEQSAKAYGSAIALRPGDGASHFNLGNLLKAQGRIEQAVLCFEKASICFPQTPGALNNLANTLLQLGRFKEAVDAFKNCLHTQPDDQIVRTNLGAAYLEVGELEQAVECFRLVAKMSPGKAASHVAIGRAEIARGNVDAAIAAYQHALKLDSGCKEARTGLASAFRVYSPVRFRPQIVSSLLLLFDDQSIAPQDLARLSANQLRHTLNLKSSASSLGAVTPVDLDALSCNRLLLCMLTRTIVTDPVIEEFLQLVRRKLLSELSISKGRAGDYLTLAGAIATQSFINEFLYEISDTEAILIAATKQLLSELETPSFNWRECLSPVIQIRLIIVGMYLPLEKLPYAKTLSDANLDRCDQCFQRLIQRSVQEPLCEVQLRNQVARLKPISDQVSHAVQDQYEDNPYPRWFDLPQRASSSYYQYLGKMFPHYHPPDFLNEKVQVLSAGCGTGREAAAIACYRSNTEVLGLDLSVSSLAHGIRVSKKLGIDNLSFIQGDITHCEKLNKAFHVVESSGVLHHMADPLLGWRALVDCLVPGGLMKIGLYSERSSVDVAAAQSMIRQRGLDSSSSGIQQVRKEILNAAQQDPVYSLRFSDDFYTMSACRDLLFHVQEQCFTLDRIGQALDTLGLQFIGFELPMADTRHRYRELNPVDTNMTDLALWSEFERRYPATFAAMYVFWCYKKTESLPL